jgi:hypothetical protein
LPASDERIPVPTLNELKNDPEFPRAWGGVEGTRFWKMLQYLLGGIDRLGVTGFWGRGRASTALITGPAQLLAPGECAIMPAGWSHGPDGR